jgi:phage terminase small subunit
MMEIPKTQQQIDFCNFLIQGLNQREAATAAGYSEATAHVKGSQLFKQFQDYIITETADMLKTGGAEAYQVMLELMRRAKQDAVRLKAATAVLDYGGYKPVEKIDMTVDQKSDEELDGQLATLLTKAGLSKGQTLQ